MKILYINSPKYDLVTALHIEGLEKIPNIEVCYTSLGNYAPKNKVLNEEKAYQYAMEIADVVILGSRPYVNINLFKQITKKNIMKIVMEGGDESYINYSIFDFNNIDYLFKREIYKNENSFKSLIDTLKPQNFGLWYKIKSFKYLKYPYFHSMSNVAGLKRGMVFKVFFKNLILSNFFSHKVYPFNLGIEDRFIGKFNDNPKFFLSCMMRPHNQERKELINLLKSFNIENIFLEQIYPEDTDIQWMIKKGACHPDFCKIGGIGMAQNNAYFEQITNSLACISIPGGGFDTLRFWEILARGSLLITKRIAIEIPNAPIEGKHYLAFDTIEELKNIISFVINNPKKVNSIRKEGYLFALKYHSSKARAEYFLDIIKNRSMNEK